MDKPLEDFFKAANGYPQVPEGKNVYVVRGKEAFAELKEKLRPFAPQAPLMSNVPALVDMCPPWNVEDSLEDQMKRAAHHYGGNLFYVPERDYLLNLTWGLAVGEVYILHLTESNNPFRT